MAEGNSAIKVRSLDETDPASTFFILQARFASGFLWSPNKTDQEDAKLIAHFCATQVPQPWTPPSLGQRALQAMVRHLDALQTMRQQESNRLQAGVPSAAVRDTLAAHMTFLDEQIDQLTQRMGPDHMKVYISGKEKNGRFAGFRVTALCL